MKITFTASVAPVALIKLVKQLRLFSRFFHHKPHQRIRPPYSFLMPSRMGSFLGAGLGARCFSSLGDFGFSVCAKIPASWRGLGKIGFFGSGFCDAHSKLLLCRAHP